MKNANKQIVVLGGVEFVSMSLASEILQITKQVFGAKLPEMEKNGVRVFRIGSRNKGTKVCREDIEDIRNKAIETGKPITDIQIGKHNELGR